MAHQQSLFDTAPAPWELDDASERSVATVVLADGPAGEFDYLVPDPMREQLAVGCRVQAPLGRGNRLVTGYCIALATRAVGPRPLKPLKRLIDEASLLGPAMLRLTRWIADYYLCPWGQVLETVVPAAVRSAAGTRQTTFFSLSPQVAAEFADGKLKLTPKQQKVVATLAASDGPLPGGQLAARAGCTQAPINTLRKKGLLTATQGRIRQFAPEEVLTEREAPLELNSDQQRALEAILESLQSSRHRTVLMHGVTGSGKTEVYMQAIDELIGFGRQAIVLVPEISLTPQTRRRFRRRFDRVAVLHSHLSDSERAWHWHEIAAGRVNVVVGARSAVFAPTPDLGMIVLDEEHESSFKQESAPRYHARDVAIRRAADEEVPLVLGSATPSLESWHRAATGEYQLVEMPSRVLDRPLPDVRTIDLRSESHARGGRGAISRPLHQAMEASLRAGEQVILLLNRRGFSTHMQCPACGEVVRCPNCEIALTHHRQEELAICHYCDFRIAAPLTCPECKSPGIRYSGRGTQKLEAEVRARFPRKTCLRMDTDSMQRPGSHERALDRFRNGEVDILLGTQMIAKGLDFPNVTLVGVVNADTALNLPDFRAAERTFHLVTQVAGRTGRGEKGGRVLVQTFNPDDPAIQAAVRHDYARFAAAELPQRKQLDLPPYSSQVRLVVRGKVEEGAEAYLEEISRKLQLAAEAAGSSVALHGPAPAPIPKLRGLYRFHLLAQSSHRDALHATVATVTGDLKPIEGIQWIVDVDPQEMM